MVRVGKQTSLFQVISFSLCYKKKTSWPYDNSYKPNINYIGKYSLPAISPSSSRWFNRCPNNITEAMAHRILTLNPFGRYSYEVSKPWAPVVRELRLRQGSSSDDLSTSSDTFASKTRSMPALTSPGRSRVLESTAEAGVSFEDDPNSSSLEGLQAAHDRIKLAPKRRRPPSRKSGSVTSSLSTDSPVRNEQLTPHRRSKTDPKDLSKDRLDTNLDSSSLSDVLNNTIFEEEETFKSTVEPSEEKSIDERKAAMDDIASRANKALSHASGPSKFASKEVEKTAEDAGLDKSSSTKSDASKLTDQDVEKRNELLKTEREVEQYSPVEKLKTEAFSPSRVTEREMKATPKNEESKKTSSSNSDSPSPKPTSPKILGVKSLFKRHSLDANMTTSFSESVVASKSDSDILRTEFTSLLLREACEKPWLDNKKSGESVQKNNSNKTETPTSPNKKPQITPKPFKRGKSWSNNHTPKLIEYPINQGKEVTKKNNINNNTSESEENEKENENTTPFSEKKDYQFSRTKSWHYGMKPKEASKSTNNSCSDDKKAPSWVAKANRMSQRMSQLIQNDETSENQAPTLRKTSIPKEQEPTKPKSRPAGEDPVKPKLATKKTLADKDTKTAQTSPKPAPRPKPSSFVKSSASLPRIVGSGANVETKSVPTVAKNNSEMTKKTAESAKSVQQAAKSSFENVKLEKCIVCGTTVYQMEKCKFDDCVLHRNCMKCAICKRHLTVGNFVLTESKIYCKPHSRTVVAVST